MIHPRRALPSRSFAAIIAAGLLIAGCSAGEDEPSSALPPATTSLERRTLVVAQSPLFSDSTVAFARDEGWFEQAGLEVTVIEGRNTSDLTPLLLTGEVDAAYLSITTALGSAMAEDVGIRIVAAGVVMEPGACTSYGLIVLPGTEPRLDLENPVALGDWTIGGPFSGGYLGRWFLETLADRAGLEPDDLDLMNVWTVDATATLVSGGVDALMAAEPALTRIRQEFGGEVLAGIGDVLPGSVLYALYFGPRLLADPELAARYLAVHLRAAARHAEGATERNVAVLSATTGLEPELLREMCWDQQDSMTLPHVDAVTAAFSFAQRIGELDVVPRPDQVWDHTVRERALELLASWEAPTGE
jgi:ABC-type nitrate/sulfonate/bicarbonate transport system substrate-binding protein